MIKIKIVIIEDNLGWLTAVTTFLNSYTDLLVIGTATNREDAIRTVRSLEPDIVLMDINLSGNKKDGIFASIEILEFSKAKIIMMTSIKDEEIIVDSFTAGAINFISKDKYMDLPNAIRSAYNSVSPFEVLLKKYSMLVDEAMVQELTPSEKELFELMQLGFSRSQIENRLFKTRNTIKAQVKAILAKMKAASMKEAIRKVKYRGISE